MQNKDCSIGVKMLKKVSFKTLIYNFYKERCYGNS